MSLKQKKMSLQKKKPSVPEISDDQVEAFGDQAETETQKRRIVQKVKKRIKTVRDTFTMPQPEYDQIEKLRIRAMKKGIDRNKSEMIRAGLKALTKMNETEFKEAINQVTRTKRGCK